MVIKCPYCMTDNTLSEANLRSRLAHNCEECGRSISSIFINKKRDDKWCSIGMVGFPNHGKTVYVTSLFYLMKNVLMGACKWNGFHMFALDMSAVNMVYNRIEELMNCNLPDSTAANFPEPCLVQFSSLPAIDTLFTSFYDISGEVYSDLSTISENARIIAKSKTLFFMVSITDNENWQNEIHQLLNIYVLALHNKLALEPKRYQHLVVVITKADMITDRLPPDLKDDLLNGDYTKYKSVSLELLEQLQNSSLKIEQWLKDNNAGGFVSLAKGTFKSVSFTMVSALGSKPDGSKLQSRIDFHDPRNALDPFLLALGNQFDFPSAAPPPEKTSWHRRLLGRRAK